MAGNEKKVHCLVQASCEKKRNVMQRAGSAASLFPLSHFLEQQRSEKVVPANSFCLICCPTINSWAARNSLKSSSQGFKIRPANVFNVLSNVTVVKGKHLRGSNLSFIICPFNLPHKAEPSISETNHHFPLVASDATIS